MGQNAQWEKDLNLPSYANYFKLLNEIMDICAPFVVITTFTQIECLFSLEFFIQDLIFSSHQRWKKHTIVILQKSKKKWCVSLTFQPSCLTNNVCGFLNIPPRHFIKASNFGLLKCMSENIFKTLKYIQKCTYMIITYEFIII